MTNTNFAIIFYSMTGTNYKLAKWSAEAAKEAGANVKILKVAENAPKEVVDSKPEWKSTAEATKDIPIATPDDMVWADAIIFSMPTRFGSAPSQVRQFIDQLGGVWFEGKLVNKSVSVMSTAQNVHGGQVPTILGMYTSFYHWGAVVSAPGFIDPVVYSAGGCPYGVAVTIDQDGKIQDEAAVEKAVKSQTLRTIDIATKIKK